MPYRNTELLKVKKQVALQVDRARGAITPELGVEYKNASLAEQYRILARQARSHGKLDVEKLFLEQAEKQDRLDAELLEKQNALHAQIACEVAEINARHEAGILKEAFDRGPTFRVAVITKLKALGVGVKARLLPQLEFLRERSQNIFIFTIFLSGAICSVHNYWYGLAGQWLAGSLFGLIMLGCGALIEDEVESEEKQQVATLGLALVCLLFVGNVLFNKVVAPFDDYYIVVKEKDVVVNRMQSKNTIFMPAPKWWKGNDWAMQLYSLSPRGLEEEWKSQKVQSNTGDLKVTAGFEVLPTLFEQDSPKTEMEYQEDIRTRLKAITQDTLAGGEVDLTVLKDKIVALQNPGYKLKDVTLVFSPTQIVVKQSVSK